MQNHRKHNHIIDENAHEIELSTSLMTYIIFYFSLFTKYDTITKYVKKIFQSKVIDNIFIATPFIPEVDNQNGDDNHDQDNQQEDDIR